MAIVKFNSGITGVSGTAGRVVYRHDRYGNHLQRLPTKHRKGTANQNSVRKAFRQCLNLFYHGDISEAVIDQWRLYSSNHPVTNALGEVHLLQPIHYFLKYNMPRILNKLDVVMTPPA